MKSKIEIHEMKLVYKPPKTSIKISTSQEAFEFLSEKWDFDTIRLYEEFYVVFLNRNMGVIGYKIIGRGGINGVVVDIRLILAMALLCASSSLILAHNHPSENLQPSQPDIEITKRLVDAAKIHDIKVSDHLIVTEQNYFSFADEGLI